MNRILCSTGALIGRPNGRDFTLLSKFSELLECDGYEFMMYDSWYEKINCLKSFMKTFSAPICVFHADKGIGDLISSSDVENGKKALSLFETNCALAGELGAEFLVLHLWNGIKSDKSIQYNIDFYGRLSELSAKYGLNLTVENVVCSYFDPMTHFATLANTYPNIQFTYDTKMAAFHNQMNLLYQEHNRHIASKIKHMHINDYRGGYKDWKNLKTLHIGNGQIDFDSFFNFVKSIRYDGDFTVEATAFDQSGVVDFDALNRSFWKIRRFMN